MINKTSIKKTAKKTTPAKRPVKKAATSKPIKQTNIIANVDIGFGNTLYIRGEGAGLSWDKGIPLENISSSEWKLTIKQATGAITFKFLINDQVWAEGENLLTKAGSQSVSSPFFVW